MCERLDLLRQLKTLPQLITGPGAQRLALFAKMSCIRKKKGWAQLSSAHVLLELRGGRPHTTASPPSPNCVRSTVTQWLQSSSLSRKMPHRLFAFS